MIDRTPGILSRDRARQYYDRFGAKQDRQSFYADPIFDWLLHYGDFDRASRVFEFGCGTGRFAHQLIQTHLPETASYVGVDVSTTMVHLARETLSEFGQRAQVIETNGTPQIGFPDASFDRFLSTYVLDLLAPSDIAMVLQEAHRVLRPEGLLCLAGITTGHTCGSRIAMTLWQGVNYLWPSLLGGCRPLQLEHLLAANRWQIRYRTLASVRGIASEAVIGSKR